MSEIAVVVLAAGDLRARVIGPAPAFQRGPVMLPFGGRLALDRIRHHYAAAEPAPRLYLAHDPRQTQCVPIRALEGFESIDVGSTPDVCSTVERALEQVREEHVVLNPITTLPVDAPRARCEIHLGREPLHQERWSSVQVDRDGAAHFLFRDDGGPPPRAFPFTGILSGPRDELRSALGEVEAEHRGDLLRLAARLHGRGRCALVHSEWIDLGHRATYALAQRRALSSRAFNSVTYAADRDLIVKRSSDRRTLEREGRYLAALPAPLRRYFPSLIASEPDPSLEHGWQLSLEYVPFPTLAETFLHWDVGPNAWDRILGRLAAVLGEFERCLTVDDGDCGWLYGEKLAARSADLRERLTREDERALPLDAELVINGRRYPSLARSIEALTERLAPLERSARLGWTHGDLCLGNILCDPLFGAIKLIDPRGRDEVGVLPGIGDPRYDLAKLNHSFHGLYDVVVNDLFRVNESGPTIDLELYRPPNHEFLLGAFRERLLDGRLDRDQAELLTASLFLSMLPLHAEDPGRLRALAAIGVVLLHDGSTARLVGRD